MADVSLLLLLLAGAPNSNICLINGSLGRNAGVLIGSFGLKPGVIVSLASPDDAHSLVMLLCP